MWCFRAFIKKKKNFCLGLLFIFESYTQQKQWVMTCWVDILAATSVEVRVQWAITATCHGKLCVKGDISKGKQEKGYQSSCYSSSSSSLLATRFKGGETGKKVLLEFEIVFLTVNNFFNDTVYSFKPNFHKVNIWCMYVHVWLHFGDSLIQDVCHS